MDSGPDRSLSFNPRPRPRLRGTDDPRCSQINFHRFIPASAGNGTRNSSSHNGDAVHPRACGERNSNALEEAVDSGSSPRLRGTAAGDPDVVEDSRFIPASAGNGYTGDI